MIPLVTMPLGEEDRSHAVEKPSISPSVSKSCACNDLKGHHVPRVTTIELVVDDMHSADAGSNSLQHVSRASIPDDKIMISFHHNDPDNPYNWSRVRLVLIL